VAVFNPLGHPTPVVSSTQRCPDSRISVFELAAALLDFYLRILINQPRRKRKQKSAAGDLYTFNNKTGKKQQGKDE
jgi:hypothetical protein